MNLRGIMKKLQTALLHVGVVIRVNQKQWYSQEQNRLLTQYTVITNVQQKDKQGRWKEREYEILKTHSPIEVIQCLGDIYKVVK